MQTRIRLIQALRGSRRAVAMLEFGLSLPLFLGFVLSGIEMANYAMAVNRTQRLASMAADLVAQSGAGAIGATEAQIYDLFNALDLTAQPFDLRQHGRIILTGVKGTDANNDNIVDNTILWQRFDGNYVAAVPKVGCNQNVTTATLPESRRLSLDEITFHAQVTYQYQPVFSSVPFEWLDLPTSFTRTALFRARSTQFQTPSPDDRFPPKKKCDTATGL
jgi:Flp pilus assembly protein TadG